MAMKLKVNIENANYEVVLGSNILHDLNSHY